MYAGPGDAADPGSSGKRQYAEKLPQRLRLLLPALMAADMALLVAAHVLEGASTEVAGEAPLGLLRPHTASSDNLFSAARRLFNAHAYASVAIVVGLSGLWPYVKLFGTLAAVALVDLGTISLKGGRRWLQVLEVLGKYSFADVFLICFNFVIFDVSSGGTYRVVGFFNLEIHLWMQLHFASMALIVAVTFSTFLTHWASFEMARPSGEERPLLESVEAGERPAAAAAPAASWLHIGAVIVSIAGCVFLLVGAFMPMVRVGRGGFLGNLIRPEQDRTLELSIISIVDKMLSGEGAHNVYNLVMVVFFVGLTFAAPLLEFLFLGADAVACWLKAPWAHWTAFGAEWVHSFGCVDVLLIVAVVLVMELHTVVEFNIGDECAPFESVMNNRALLTIAGLGFATSSECFETSPQLRPGWGLLLFGVIGARFAAWRLNAALRGPKVI